VTANPRDTDPDDGADKKPAAPSVCRGEAARIEGGNPDLGWAENDYAIVDPDINSASAEPTPKWFLQTELAPPPDSGKADSLEEAEAQYQRRDAEMKSSRRGRS
jgi:hypothetical protein